MYQYANHSQAYVIQQSKTPLGIYSRLIYYYHLSFKDNEKVVNQLILLYFNVKSFVFLKCKSCNIPRTVTHLPEMKNGLDGLPKGILSTTNDLGLIGYIGPCPPNGETHRYEFTLYALSKKLPLGLTSREVSTMINQYMVDRIQLTALYTST